MAMEDKKDNKVDTSRNGRPMSFSLGDGEDLTIDLPHAVPGIQGIDLDNMNEEEAQRLLASITENTAQIEALLKEAGVDLDNFDMSQFDN